VRIKNRDFLERFQQTWKFHHPLQDSQLRHAGQTAAIAWLGYYFGADEIYMLEGIRGTWHECCLEPANRVGGK
jgi:hypothetical protein